MNMRLCLLAPLALSSAYLCSLGFAKAPEPPVPVMKGDPAPQQLSKPDTQKLYGPSSANLVPVEQARRLIERFKDSYPKMGNPRLLFYVNRELVDNTSGLKLESHKQTVVQNSSGQTVTSDSSYSAKEAPQAPISDRQTTREIERLMGRVFRTAGAELADQAVASTMLATRAPGTLAANSSQASQDRESLSKVADIVIEVLVSSRLINVTDIAGDQQITAPDIQVTAIRLKDATIVGQASSSDLLGKDRNAGKVLKTFDVRDITEGTAFALMDDMLSSAK